MKQRVNNLKGFEYFPYTLYMAPCVSNTHTHTHAHIYTHTHTRNQVAGRTAGLWSIMSVISHLTFTKGHSQSGWRPDSSHRRASNLPIKTFRAD